MPNVWPVFLACPPVRTAAVVPVGMYGDATGELTTGDAPFSRRAERRRRPALAALRHEGPVRPQTRRRHRTGTIVDHLAAQLERSAFVLHDLVVAGGTLSIDHVAVASSGIWVIASQPVTLERVTVHRPFRGIATLRVGDHNYTDLATDLDRQRTAICAALADQPHVPIRTAICFPGGQFPLLGTLMIDGHLVLPPSDLVAHVTTHGALRRSEGRHVAGLLARRLG